MTQLNADGTPYDPCMGCGKPTPDMELSAEFLENPEDQVWLCNDCARKEVNKRRVKRLFQLEAFVDKAKLCRSYFFEDPNRAYEILADALRELEGPFVPANRASDALLTPHKDSK